MALAVYFVFLILFIFNFFSRFSGVILNFFFFFSGFLIKMGKVPGFGRGCAAGSGISRGGEGEMGNLGDGGSGGGGDPKEALGSGGAAWMKARLC